MDKQVIAAIVGAFTLLFAGEGMASAQVSVSDRLPLLEFHGVSTLTTLTPGAGVNYSSPALVVFRDGFAVSSFVSGVIEGNSPQPFTVHVVQGVLPAAFADLSRALQRNMIGLQSGDCLIPPTSFGSNYDFEVSPTSACRRTRR